MAESNHNGSSRIDPGSGRPIYQQLADILRQQILTGSLGPGDLLPSEPTMVRQHSIGREAVRQAIATLRAEGLVDTTRGRGSQVRPPLQRNPVPLGPGDRVIARMPTDPQRHRHDIDYGVPVLEIRRADGTTEFHPADNTELVGRTPRTPSPSDASRDTSPMPHPLTLPDDVRQSGASAAYNRDPARLKAEPLHHPTSAPLASMTPAPKPAGPPPANPGSPTTSSASTPWRR